MTTTQDTETTPRAIKVLLAYIRSHGFNACFIDGALMAEMTYAVPTSTGIGFEARWEQIPNPTLRTVRQWLGY